MEMQTIELWLNASKANPSPAFGIPTIRPWLVGLAFAMTASERLQAFRQGMGRSARTPFCILEYAQRVADESLGMPWQRNAGKPTCFEPERPGGR
jgi:hypothetical protein